MSDAVPTSPLGPVLSGARVLVTAQRRADDIVNALQRRGASVVVASSLGVESHIDEESLVAETRALVERPADVVVVTTGIGFRSWLDTAEAVGLGHELLESLQRSRVVARGPKARGALQAAGLLPDWVAESETSAEIADFLRTDGVAGQRIVVQHHGAGDDGLERHLTAAGATTSSLIVYRWGPPADPEAVRRSAREAAAGGYDAVLFTSAPGAAAWLEALRAEQVLGPVMELVDAGLLRLAAVGEVTAAPLRDLGMDVLVPPRARLGALLRSLVLDLGDDEGALPTPAGMLRVRATAATLDHAPLAVSPGGLALLRCLAADPGRVRSRDELLDVLPGDSRDPHTVEVAVARLREAVGREVVRTVVKRGYRLELAGA